MQGNHHVWLGEYNEFAFFQDFLVASHSVSVKLRNEVLSTSNKILTTRIIKHTSPQVTFTPTQETVSKAIPDEISPTLPLLLLDASPPSPAKDYRPGPPLPPTPDPSRPQPAVDPLIVRPASQKLPSKQSVDTGTETITKEPKVSNPYQIFNENKILQNILFEYLFCI